jgi:hypothetical protein
VEESTGTFEVLPKGKYPCIINTSSEKATKAGTGSYFEFEFEVVKGDFAKRKLWARLNVNNPSEVAQNIGRAQFKALCKAAGKPEAKTTEALHGKYVVCAVSIERGDRGDMNRVDGFIFPVEFKAQGGEAPSKADAAAEAAAKGKGGAKGKTAPKEGDFDDDIPF